ncbi:Putative centrosomal protein nuf [Gryllus bimaculatus]|nr:Putative centrosomal protein nuf [Gryllus bimaculatus]
MRGRGAERALAARSRGGSRRVQQCAGAVGLAAVVLSPCDSQTLARQRSASLRVLVLVVCVCARGREPTMMAPVYHPQPSSTPTAAQPAPAPTFVLQDCDADSAIGDSASPDLQAKSQCSSMSDGEQFECYGENVELELEPESPPRPQNGVNGVHMLEEQLREAELRAEERLQEEQRRHREMMARVDREKELHVENYSIRLQTLELEAGSLREETSRLRAQMERLRGEKASAEERLAEAEATAATLRAEALAVRDAERRSREEAAREQAASAQLVDELSRDLEQLRKEQGVSNPADSQHSAHLAELQSELSRLRQENKSLRETNEDLQAQILTRGVEEGRNLLGSGNSIAAELEAMSGEEHSRNNRK